jgi:hypothetical protein
MRVESRHDGSVLLASLPSTVRRELAAKDPLEGKPQLAPRRQRVARRIGERTGRFRGEDGHCSGLAGPRPTVERRLTSGSREMFRTHDSGNYSRPSGIES